MSFKNIIVCIVMVFFSHPLLATKPITVGNLVLDSYWVRPGTGRPNTAAYVTIKNTSKTQDKLVKVDCAHATHVELHTHIEENGIMKMRPVPSINLENTVTMQPGGLHIMLMGLKDTFQGLKQIPITLNFENEKSITILFPVEEKV